MAKAQNELVHTLEDKVAARSAEASKYAEQNARLEERNHLSQELHDAVSQTLFSANLIADTMPNLMKNAPDSAIEALHEVRALNKNALVEMRNLLIELRSKKLSSSSLGLLVKELVSDMEGVCSAKLHFQIEGDAALPEDVQHTLYRVAQECLSNAVQHSDASVISVYFDSMASQAILTVKDDGRGFETGQDWKGSFGLQIMNERMIKIGGTLEIETDLETGTQVTAIWMADNGR